MYSMHMQLSQLHYYIMYVSSSDLNISANLANDFRIAVAVKIVVLLSHVSIDGGTQLHQNIDEPGFGRILQALTGFCEHFHKALHRLSQPAHG